MIGSYCDHSIVHNSFDQQAFTGFDSSHFLTRLTSSNVYFEPATSESESNECDVTLKGADTLGIASVPSVWKTIYNRITEGKSIEVIAPTGYGKTTLYQLIALNLPKGCLVVTPLLSLAVTQRDFLRSKGISAALWSHDELNFRQPPKFLFITPEAIAYYLNRLYQMSSYFDLLVFDELSIFFNHKHFRLKFGCLALLRGVIKAPCYLCSAPFVGIKDAEEILGIKDIIRYKSGGVLRSNAVISFNQYTNKAELRATGLLPFVLSTYRHGAGIVFVRTRKEVETIAKFLAAKLPEARILKYHSKLKGSASLAEFMAKDDKIKILVSTTACAYGLNNTKVSWVAMYGLPYSINDFLQMAGRAGREKGTLAFIWCGYSQTEENAFRRKSSRAFGSDRQSAYIKQYEDLLKVINETDICRHMAITKEVTGEQVQPCKMCDICTHVQQRKASRYLRLKRLRRHLAITAKTPEPFIFTDDCLKQIVIQQPKAKKDLLGIKGLKCAKVDRYGGLILAMMYGRYY